MNLVTELGWVNLVLFIAGIALLVKGSDFFVDSAAAMAKRFGVSDVVIGLTLVSIGTSLPELAANLCASFQGASAIALGNIVGSNISNVTFILGLSCILIGRIDMPREMFKRDGVIMLCATLTLLAGFFIFSKLHFWMGLILFLGCIAYTLLLVKNSADSVKEEAAEKGMSLGLAALLFIVGLLMIFAGSKLVVDNTIWASLKLGLSQTVIASTVVALGTSLPELAVTISGVLKKQHGIALGNILGSNIFNILMILGVSAMIHPIVIEESAMYFNLAMLLCSDMLLVGMMGFQRKLVRWNGIVLVIVYIIFIAKNISALK